MDGQLVADHANALADRGHTSPETFLLFLLALFGFILILMYGGPVFVSAVVQILLMWAGTRQVLGEWIVTRLQRIPEQSVASTVFRVFDADHDPTRERLERVQ